MGTVFNRRSTDKKPKMTWYQATRHPAHKRPSIGDADTSHTIE
jgi:hypothetical protein